MVLSNKKLKQKLREELAKASPNKPTDVQSVSFSDNLRQPQVNPQSQVQSSSKNLSESSTRTPRLSKREIRRRKVPSHGSVAVVSATEYDDGCEHSADSNGKQDKGAGEMERSGHEVEALGEKTEKEKKKKKRKRTEKEVVGDGGLGSDRIGDLVNREETEKRSEKKGKKMKKEKMKKKKEKEKKKKEKKKKEEMAKSVVDKGTEHGGEEGTEKEVESNHNSIRQDNGEVTSKVYVGGIPFYSTEDDIRSYFDGCGTITEVDCMMFPETGNFRGIAIISFKTEAAAKRALALDGADMGGLFLKIQPYKVKRANKTSDFAPEIKEGYNRVYVGNLPWDITEDELRTFFSSCNISSMRFGMDKETGNFKGFAHVDFSDNESLTKALKLDQMVLSGRNVVIRGAVPLKKANNNASSLPLNEAANHEEPSPVSGKLRRRACFVCRKKGHEFSSCPSLAESKAEPSDTLPPK